MDCHVIKVPSPNESRFPYFVLDTENRLWLVKGEGSRGCFKAAFAQGNHSYLPFQYEGDLSKSSVKKMIDRSRIQINIGSLTGA